MNEDYLTQRLEDLNGRLEELTERLPDSRLDERYDRLFYARLTGECADAVIPAHLYTVQDVLEALRRTRDRLAALRRERELARERRAAAAIPGQLVIDGFAAAGLRLAS